MSFAVHLECVVPKNCGDLGFGAKHCLDVSWKHAHELCKRHTYRLCSGDELMEIGEGVDGVWSSDSCDYGKDKHAIASGNKKTAFWCSAAKKQRANVLCCQICGEFLKMQIFSSNELSICQNVSKANPFPKC